MDLDLERKAFVVGGGSSRLGRAVSEVLVADGSQVVRVSRDEAKLTADAAELGSLPSACAADLGGVGGLLVDAGGPAPGSVLEVACDPWESVLRLLLGGAIRLIRALTPQLRIGAAISTSPPHPSGLRFRASTCRACFAPA